MGLDVRYQAPKISPLTVIAAAAASASHAMAETLLEAAEPLVPVDTGELQLSGHVEHDGHAAAVVFSAVNPKDGYNYAAKVHEDLEAHHPNGGQAKYLEAPLHGQHAEMLESGAAAFRGATRS